MDLLHRIRRTILVVEDEEDDQYLIERALRDNGVTNPVHAVRNGSEAIAYLLGDGEYSDRKQYAYPGLIITDLSMPSGDGFAVLEHLKGNPDWAVIPTVVLTSSSDPDDIKKAYQLGASAYHVKPSDFNLLRKVLKLLYEYWSVCEVPEADRTGRLLPTKSKGKLGERFSEQAAEKQQRVKPQ